MSCGSKKEEWKPVIGFEKEYLISSHGRLKSLTYNRLMKPSSSGPYLHATLTKNGRKAEKNIHRLVAEAFVENPNGYSIVNHIDEDKLNNNASNLEWCTAKYNATYGSAKNCRSQVVRQYTVDGVVVKQWDSLKEASETTGIKYQCISKCCRHEQKTAGGYKWEYVGCSRKQGGHDWHSVSEIFS